MIIFIVFVSNQHFPWESLLLLLNKFWADWMYLCGIRSWL